MAGTAAMAGKKTKQASGGGGDQQLSQPEYVQPADPPRAVIAVHPQGAAIAVAVGPELRVYDARSKQHRVLISKPQAPAAQPEDAPQQAPSDQQQRQGGKQQKKKKPPLPPAPPLLRGVTFDATGRYLLAGSEDKAAALQLWDCSSWELLQSIKVPKKVTSIAFTPDGRHVLAADKFGDVLVATTERPAGLPAGQQQEPEILLGHYCAMLTSLALSSGGRLIATTDRDQRVRVSIMPADPMSGAHEIQSYCMGHGAFVTSSGFIAQAGQELLATGSGDGTLRLWEPLSGALLHTLQLPAVELPPLPEAQQQQEGAAVGEAVGEEQQQQQQQMEEDVGRGGGSSGDEEGGEQAAEAEAAAEAAGGGTGGSGGGGFPRDAAVPLALAASPDGSWLVAAVDGRDELCLVSIDWAGRQLQVCGWFALSGLHLPAWLTFDGTGRLWAAGGPVTDDSVAAFVACGSIGAAVPTAEGEQQQQARLVDAALPDWLPVEAVQKLEAKVGEEGAQLAAAAERRRLASQVLKKRQYSLQQLEHRKRHRRDKVAAATAATEAAPTDAASKEQQ